MTIGVKQLAHVCVFTDDVEKSEEFYTKAIGLTKVFDFYRDKTKMGFYLSAGERTFVEVFHHSEAPFQKTGPVNHLCFEVYDIDVAASKLTDIGIEVTPKKFGVDDTWQVWLKDPSGTPIELFMYTNKSAQFVGGDRVVDW